MAIRIHAVAAARWLYSGRNDPELASLTPLAAGDMLTDMTEQLTVTALATNIYLIDADLAQATAAAINNAIGASSTLSAYVLAQESYDDADPSVRTGNFDDVPTSTQLTTFGTQLLNRFPGLTVEQLQNAGQSILQNGLTRRQIIAALEQRFAQL